MKFKLPPYWEPSDITNKQLFTATAGVCCVAQVTNYTPLRTPVQWLFCIMVIVCIYRLFQTKIGKKVGNALLFAAFMENFRGRR
jgi:hypothetical protein